MTIGRCVLTQSLTYRTITVITDRQIIDALTTRDGMITRQQKQPITITWRYNYYDYDYINKDCNRKDCEYMI